MAKTFGQYTGGIEAATGNLVPAYGQMADQTFRTMAGLASTITKTYDTLNQQEEENSANKELIKGQQGNLTAIKKLMDANPDTKDSPLSQSINEMIVKLGTAGDLNRGQLKGLLKSSEVFTSQLPLTMQLQDKAFLAQTTAGVQKALSALKNQTVKDSKGYDIPVPSFAGGSPEKYQKDLQTFFEQHKKDNPEVQLDVGKAVRDSLQLQIQRFTNDPDLTKADPTYKQHLIRGFEALGKRTELAGQLETQTSEDYGTGENIMGQVSAIAEQERLAGQAPADIRRGELAAQALEAQRAAGSLPPAGGVAPVTPATPAKPLVTGTQKFETAKTEAQKAVADATAEEKRYDAQTKEFVKGADAILTPEQNRQFTWLLKKTEEAKKKKEEAQTKLSNTFASDFKDDVAPAPAAGEVLKPRSAVQKSVDASKPVWAELNQTKTDLETADAELERNYKYISSEGKYVPRDGKTGNYAEAKKKRDDLEAKVGTLTEKYNSIKTSDFTDDVPTDAEDAILAARDLTDEGKYKALVSTKADKYEKKYLEELLAQVKSSRTTGDYIGFFDRFAQNAVGDERLTNEVLHDKDIARFAGRRSSQDAIDAVTAKRQELFKWVGELRDKQGLGVFESGKDMQPARRIAVRDELVARIADIDKRLKNPVEVKPVTVKEVGDLAAGVSAGTGTGKVGETATPATPAIPEAPKPDIYAMGFDYKMTIPGVFVNERPLTYEEEKEGVRKWFEENHNGVVPSTIDAVYKTIRPEAALIIKTLPTGEKLMHTEKGWTQLTQMTQPKGMTSEEKSDEGLFNFGQIVEGRRIPVEAVKGSGIMVNGFFSGGKKRAEAFAQNLQDVATLNESVPLLVEQFKKFGHSFKLWNQVEQGLAQSHIAKIRAAIRVETVGTGPVALPEHEMIAKRLGDPNALFTLDANEISKLTAILSTAKTNLQRQGTGVNVTFRPPTVAGQNPIQQNRVANAANRDSK